MILLRSVHALGSPQFDETLKQELQELPIDALPLQKGLTSGSCVIDEPRSVIVISAHDYAQTLSVRVGVLYCGIIAGCSCADDPTPVDSTNEYCEVDIELNKATGEARATLVKS